MVAFFVRSLYCRGLGGLVMYKNVIVSYWSFCVFVFREFVKVVKVKVIGAFVLRLSGL